MDDSPSHAERTATSVSRKSTAGRKSSVLIHGGLLGLAVVVVWSTIGRDPRTQAAASAIDAVDTDTLIAGESHIPPTEEPFVAASALSRPVQRTIRETHVRVEAVVPSPT
ncbi:MAG: hypothetical protein AAGL98_03320, partial [Planctomycetota bacterium]